MRCHKCDEPTFQTYQERGSSKRYCLRCWLALDEKPKKVVAKRTPKRLR
jgi:formylmethanofuran dehydrogenase subunit E